MKRYMALWLCSIAVAVPWAFTQNAYAQNTYVQNLEVKKFGVIDGINHEHNYVTIDDLSVSMALNLKVYNARKVLVNRFALKVEQKVWYVLKPNERTDIVTGIWVLPDDAVRPEEDE